MIVMLDHLEVDMEVLDADIVLQTLFSLYLHN